MLRIVSIVDSPNVHNVVHKNNDLVAILDYYPCRVSSGTWHLRTRFLVGISFGLARSKALSIQIVNLLQVIHCAFN